jgi:hypothetical protein
MWQNYALWEYPYSMLECFAPRDGGKDALWLRYKSKDNFFACAQKRTSLTLSQEIDRK